MTHSVESHLSVRPDEYDAAIRRFVPGYEAMIEALVEALARLLAGRPAPTVLDLGAGTGALSARVLERLPAARLILLDADAAMLARAERRLEAHRARIELRHGSFLDPLPACDAAVASLSLHHVHDLAAKQAVYAGVLAKLSRMLVTTRRSRGGRGFPLEITGFSRGPIGSRFAR
jgi:tRNA (cmo5U34)-methyltransferase